MTVGAQTLWGFMGKIKLRYLESSLLELARNFGIKPNQSMLNFGKMYDCFDQKRNNWMRLINVESAARHIADTFIKSPDELYIEKMIKELEEKLKKARAKSVQDRRNLLHLCGKIDLKREEYKNKWGEYN